MTITTTIIILKNFFLVLTAKIFNVLIFLYIISLIDIIRYINSIVRILIFLKIIYKNRKFLFKFYGNFKKIKKNNLSNFFNNFNKIKKKSLLNFFKKLKEISKNDISILIFPLFFSLLFNNFIIITEMESDNPDDKTIHHYVIKDGKLIEVTNDDEKIRLEKEEKEKEELKKHLKDTDCEDFFFLCALLFIIFKFSLYIYFRYFYDFYGGDDDPNDIFKDVDLDDRQQREEFLEKHPEYANEPYYTPYQKRWLGQEDRLKRKTNPHYLHCPTGDKFHTWHFDADYVDEYNKFIIEWEDDHIYKTNRFWRRRNQRNQQKDQKK